MEVTVIRAFLTQGGVAREGDRIDLPEARVRDLEQNGLVTRDVIGQTVLPKSAEPDPTMPRPTGGQTGAASAASSLPEDPPPAKRRWPRRKAAPAS